MAKARYHGKNQLDEIQRNMSKPGALGLPPLLESKRLEWAIPDGAFKMQMVFDRLLVWQLDQGDDTDVNENGERCYPGTNIVMPDVGEKREFEEAPRGILVGAGLTALDALRSNGIDLGHTITFCRHAPWRMRVDAVAGKDLYALLLRAGDITGSEDLANALRAGKCRVEVKESDKGDGAIVREHWFVDSEGVAWAPSEPFIGDDM